MSGGYGVRPTELRSSSPGFSGAADQLETAMTTLTSALQAEGACWGGDEAGQQFATGYEPAAQGATEAFDALVQALHGIRANLDGMAETWDGADSGTAAGFQTAMDV